VNFVKCGAVTALCLKAEVILQFGTVLHIKLFSRCMLHNSQIGTVLHIVLFSRCMLHNSQFIGSSISLRGVTVFMSLLLHYPADMVIFVEAMSMKCMNYW
jgi:hypothetical protein